MLICQHPLCRCEFAPRNNQQLFCTKKCQINLAGKRQHRVLKEGAKIYVFLKRKHPTILDKIQNMMKKDKQKRKEEASY